MDFSFKIVKLYLLLIMMLVGAVFLRSLISEEKFLLAKVNDSFKQYLVLSKKFDKVNSYRDSYRMESQMDRKEREYRDQLIDLDHFYSHGNGRIIKQLGLSHGIDQISTLKQSYL